MCFGLKDFVHFAHACSHFSQNHYFSQTRYGSCRSEARWWQSRARDCVITTQKDLNQGDISELYTGQARACLGCEVVSGVCHVEIVQKEFESQCYYCRMELGVCSHPTRAPSQVSYDPSCAGWGTMNRFGNSGANELIEAEATKAHV